MQNATSIHRRRLRIVATLGSLFFLVSVAAAQTRVQPTHEIQLLSRTFTPPAGVSARLRAALTARAEPRTHAIVQFKNNLTLDNHKFLAEAGIKLQGYVGGRAYHVSLPKGVRLTEGRLATLVRHADVFKASDKIKVDLAKRRYEDWAFNANTRKVKVLVEFYPDADSDAVKVALASLGIKGERYGANNSWAMEIGEDQIGKLAELDPVKSLQQGPTPFLPLNRGGKRLANTDAAQLSTFDNPQPGFQGVSGQGIRAGICDSGIDDAHDDFDEITAAGAAGASRVYNPRAGSGSHGTHVASITGGNGFNSAANGQPAFSRSGHAPRAMLGDYPNFGGSADQFYGAIVNDSTNVTNHSYVQSSTDFYDATASSLDLIVRGDGVDSQGRAIPARPQVWAAGNNGTAAQYGDEEGYYSAFTSAKNTISVGSLDTFDGRLSDYSSLGPTFDGRIKPDVVAPGCNDSIAAPSVGIQAADNDTQGYASMCGTSMAAPVVTGLLADLLEQYQTTYGVVPTGLLPSTFKVILVQSADDREKTRAYATREFNSPDTGQAVLYHAGPDFATGFGLVNAEAARALIASSDRWRESSVAAVGDTRTWCVSVPQGSRELKVAVAWDDEPGDTTTAETTAKLVNDLDLTLVEPVTNAVYQPWTLDPLPLTANPGDGAQDPIAAADVKPAYRGADHRNNVEMASIPLPKAGTWKIRVRANALPNGNIQLFSLATSHRILPVWQCPKIKICDIKPQFCRGIPEIQFRKDIVVINPHTLVPIDKICQYVVDCPGCGGAGWGYCPGWRVVMTKLPSDVVVSVVDGAGRTLVRDASGKTDRSIPVERLKASDQRFLMFTNAEGEPYGKPIELTMKVMKLAGPR